jgi:ABC-type Fe3+ transport system permease subunit
MLSSPDSVVLPVQIWLLWNQALPHEAAAAAVMLVILAVVLMSLMRRVTQLFSTSGDL